MTIVNPSAAETADASVTASNFRQIGNNTLVGSVDLTIPGWKLCFKGCLWHRNGDKEWIAFGAREWTDSSGARQYVDMVQWTGRDVHDRFQAALTAVRALAGTGQ